MLGCKTSDQSSEDSTVNNCAVTTPVWETPRDDPAVEASVKNGYYFVNENRSIWASAWWTEQEEIYLHANEEDIKIGWFRPAGADLLISGKRIDADADPLEAHIPCCYPTRFQSTGLYFPTEGCWEVKAQADNDLLSLIVWVEP